MSFISLIGLITLQEVFGLEAKNRRSLSHFRARLCVKEIHILIAKGCEKLSKMSAELEVDESYFLLRCTCNFVARRCKMCVR
ncbi:hypothetical protein [Campylobacter troglodytis]|uniref:hypothetical protein n=1 Tax=Campylobacter troglodytis TaxID=654363 RepID=UPI00115B8281|nr:hypothetical protein [Campylobacter troglodytis]TQR61028.1 hypothetical protein DMC01_03185 [Campylobacter troglodytis]